jgi:hypothetical protein
MVARRTVLGVAAACALIGVLPARALASPTEQSIMIDDIQLIYSKPAHVAQELEQMASLGINQVKISMVWSLVAPDANSTHEPKFDATDPAAYPAGVWDRYDTVVRLANELGISVYFQLTAPTPRWATPLHPKPQPYHWYPYVQDPNPKEFGQFAQAVGERYSGSYKAPAPAGDPSPSSLRIPVGGNAPNSGVSLTLPPILTGSSPPPPSSETIPRVSTWGIWNEPNLGSWLNPQYLVLPHHRTQLVVPKIYRTMANDAWKGLAASGHGSDTILVGETASGGITMPLPFVRGLYCVNNSGQQLRGHAATALGCPRSGKRRTFVSQNPGIFKIAGYAHHPYSFDVPPNRPDKVKGGVSIYNLGALERLLNQIFDADGQRRRGGVPIYLTEWGYKSDPPNPFVHTTLDEQANWLNQGEYMSWRLPYVRSLAQFLLIDNPPQDAEPVGTRAYWSTFQSGLIELNGTYKPAYIAYRLPIWVPDPHHGSRVTVWGLLRPANHTQLQYAVLEFRAKGKKSFVQLREIQTSSTEGYLLAHVAIPSAGQIKLAWLDPSGNVAYSRTVTIS